MLHPFCNRCSSWRSTSNQMLRTIWAPICKQKEKKKTEKPPTPAQNNRKQRQKNTPKVLNKAQKKHGSGFSHNLVPFILLCYLASVWPLSVWFSAVEKFIFFFCLFFHEWKLNWKPTKQIGVFIIKTFFLCSGMWMCWKKIFGCF